jgi:hypothetical protein
MPVHRVSNAEMEEALERIEKSERVVSVVPAGPSAYMVVTETKRAKPGEKETR